MRSLHIGVTMAIAAALTLAPIAASADVGDSVSGSGTSGFCAPQAFEFDAIGGPGTAATGSFHFSCDYTNPSTPDYYLSGVINCLVVEGHQAFISGTITESSFATGAVGRELGVVVTDSHAGPTPGEADTISNYYWDWNCGYPPETYTLPIVSGDIVVTEGAAPVFGPAAKDDCKEGGHLNYPTLGFSNQGLCIRHVLEQQRGAH